MIEYQPLPWEMTHAACASHPSVTPFKKTVPLGQEARFDIHAEPFGEV
jgi:hypothetical protein